MTDDEQKKKRRRVGSRDEIIGLDVGGRLFYSSRSTLTTMNAKGSALAARLDGGIPAGNEYQDDRGRSVYFIDRNGDLFQYILDYLRKDSVNLPNFAQRPELWRAIREEAEYYSIEGLTEKLYVTHEIEPNKLASGVFHWLGTNKGTEPYMNPYERGNVKIFDGLNQPIQESRIGDEHHLTPGALVQYRAPVYGFRESDPVEMFMCNAKTECSLCRGRDFSVVVDLCSVLVRPTAYSLRYSGGMYHEHCDSWNLEGSFDGKEWDVLHAARNDQHLQEPRYNDLHNLCETIEERLSRNAKEQAFELPLLYAEEHLRHTWDIDDKLPKFYRLFRLTSVPGNEGSRLNAVGFEVFGEIHEP